MRATYSGKMGEIKYQVLDWGCVALYCRVAYPRSRRDASQDVLSCTNCLSSIRNQESEHVRTDPHMREPWHVLEHVAEVLRI